MPDTIITDIEIIPEENEVFTDFSEVEIDYDNQDSRLPALPSLPDLDAAVEVWIRKKVAHGDPRPDTVAGYKNEIKLWFNWCAESRVHPAEITPSDLETFRANLVKSGMAASTISRKLSVINRFYTAAVEDGYIKKNPAKDVRPPKDRRAKDKNKHLARSEMQRLLAAIPNDGNIESMRDRAIIALEMIEGWRRVETHRANIEDIEEESHEGYRILVRGKIRDGFSYPEDSVREVLTEYLQARGPVSKDIQNIHNKKTPMTPMFCALSKAGRSTRRLSRRGINYVVDKYLRLAGLKKEDFSCHALRHTCGYTTYAKTKDLRHTQDKLRHTDPKTTAIYAATDRKYDRSEETIPLKTS